MSWAQRLPAILSLESRYDEPYWLFDGQDSATHEVQPMIDFKYDDEPGCERGDFCCCQHDWWRQDCRAGREMPYDEFLAWVTSDHPMDDCHAHNFPRKAVTGDSVTVPEANARNSAANGYSPGFYAVDECVWAIGSGTS